MEAGNQRRGEKHREVQACRQCPQAYTGEAEPRTTVRHKRTKGKTAMRGDQSEWGSEDYGVSQRTAEQTERRGENGVGVGIRDKREAGLGKS